MTTEDTEYTEDTKNINTMKLLLRYLRTSTKNQGASIDTQDEQSIIYANKKGFSTPPETLLNDSDKSGTIPIFERKRGRMIPVIISTYPNCRDIAITHPDRLGRDTEDGLFFHRWCNERGITIHFLNLGGGAWVIPGGSSGYDYTNDRARITQMFMFAEWEVNNRRASVSSALRHRRMKGLVTGTVPYGKVSVPTGEMNMHADPPRPVHRLEDCPAEQAWIWQMWQWHYGPSPYTEEHFRKCVRNRSTGTQQKRAVAIHQSCTAIARELNRRGVPTKTPAGTMIKVWTKGILHEQPSSGLWQPGNVKGVLENSHTIELVRRITGNATLSRTSSPTSDDGTRVAA